MQDSALAARLADGLTAGRIVLAAPLAVTAASGWWYSVAVLLFFAWWSDFFDGRLAQRAPGETKLGQLDLTADTLVGGVLLAGLFAGGYVALGWALAGAVLAVGYGLRRNPAWGMLLQAIGYGNALWQIGWHARPALALTGGTVVSIAIIDRSRLFGYVLPAFFAGLVGSAPNGAEAHDS